MKQNSSFRDPSGFLFNRNDSLFRQINAKGADDYNLFMNSKLYRQLLDRDWLIKHNEVDEPFFLEPDGYKVIKPEIVPFISYPYEWSFNQLKDAALLTLNIQLLSLKYGMILKDASAFNIQFIGSQPVLIDTLSFACYHEGEPWRAYRQFCQHFLAPLLLMSKIDIRLNNLLKVWIDGIPLDLTSSLLPATSWLNPSILAHIHLHAKAQKKHASTDKRSMIKVSRNGLIGIISNLKNFIEDLVWKPIGTEWVDYYNNTNYSDAAFRIKSKIIDHYLLKINPSIVWDMGSNTGFFSRLSSSRGISTIAFDIDPGAIDINYQQARKNGDKNILPLIMDLTNPSPSIGWGCEERYSLIQRKSADCIFALALIHHICISNNVPLEKAANFFASLAKHLIIEFIPKTDSQVKRLLSSRDDIFEEFTQEGFELNFNKYYTINEKKSVDGSDRILYWMARR